VDQSGAQQLGEGLAAHAGDEGDLERRLTGDRDRGSPQDDRHVPPDQRVARNLDVHIDDAVCAPTDGALAQALYRMVETVAQRGARSG